MKFPTASAPKERRGALTCKNGFSNRGIGVRSMILDGDRNG